MRVNVTAFSGSVAMVIALLFAACDKERCEPAPQTARSPDQSAELRKAAENSVRFSASNPDFVRFRGVQVWPQAVKNLWDGTAAGAANAKRHEDSSLGADIRRSRTSGPAAAFGDGAVCAHVHPCVRHGRHAPKWQHSDCTAGRNHARRTSGQGTASIRRGTRRMAPDR